MTWEKLKNVALLSLHEEHNFCSSLGDVMFDLTCASGKLFLIFAQYFN